MTTKEELKPCPFCGEEKIYYYNPSPIDHRFNCCKCLASTGSHSTKEEAMEAWNNRYEPTCTYEWCEFQPGDPNSYHAWNCSNCGEIDYDFEEPPMYCPYCRCKVVNRYGA